MSDHPKKRVSGERLAQILEQVGPIHYTIDNFTFSVVDLADDLRDARACIAAQDALLAEARSVLTDVLSGWRYNQSFHGQLAGVGWERVEDSASALLAKLEPTP